MPVTTSSDMNSAALDLKKSVRNTSIKRSLDIFELSRLRIH